MFSTVRTTGLPTYLKAHVPILQQKLAYTMWNWEIQQDILPCELDTCSDPTSRSTPPSLWTCFYVSHAWTVTEIVCGLIHTHYWRTTLEPITQISAHLILLCNGDRYELPDCQFMAVCLSAKQHLVLPSLASSSGHPFRGRTQASLPRLFRVLPLSAYLLG